MYLSALQKYIVRQCFEKGGKVTREEFRRFYETREKETAAKFQEGIITKSLERLINKGLVIGYGRRTPKKWFITHVKLTTEGVAEAKRINQARQKKLPLR